MSKKKGRYYWLKLMESFFERGEIKLIEGHKNGELLIILYLKLLLKCVGHDGTLLLKEKIPYTKEMISRTTGYEITLVEEGLKLFEELGLLYIIEEFEEEKACYYFGDLENMTGSETKNAAYKRKQKGEDDLENFQSDDGNIPTENREESIENRNKSIEDREEREEREKREKRIEKREEREREKREKREYKNLEKLKVVLSNYNFPIQTSEGMENLVQACNEYGEEWVFEGIKIADAKGIREYTYLKKILVNWEKEGKWTNAGEEYKGYDFSRYSKPIEDLGEVITRY